MYCRGRWPVEGFFLKKADRTVIFLLFIMAVKQKDIPDAVGCSLSLVSRVLSGQARQVGISPETEGVLATAKQMGYFPNEEALTLKGRATHVIGVLVYNFCDSCFRSAIAPPQEQSHKITMPL
jgi:DNA-binding LacI/PurR family transcriptional regulator